MTRTSFLASAAALVLLVSPSALAQQRHGESRGSEGKAGAVGRGGGEAGRGGGVGQPAGGGSSTPVYTGGSSRSGSSRVGTPAIQGAARRAREGEGSDRRDGVPPYSRPREGRPASGVAVPRPPGETTGRPPVLYPTVPLYGLYSLYGLYGFGYAYNPYYSSYPYGYDWYSPYAGYGDDYGYGFGSGYGSGYGGGAGSSSSYDTGSIRLKVKPGSAKVFVDGYFSGTVDQFDGAFQRLRLNEGAHRFEIRADGYEPLVFEVRIIAGQKITYEGELHKLP